MAERAPYFNSAGLDPSSKYRLMLTCHHVAIDWPDTEYANCPKGHGPRSVVKILGPVGEKKSKKAAELPDEPPF